MMNLVLQVTEFRIKFMLKHARILHFCHHKNFKFLLSQKMLLFIPLELEHFKILLEGIQIISNVCFEMDLLMIGVSGPVEKSNTYSLSPKLKAFSEWLLQTMNSGNLEFIFPAATQMYAPVVEELWRDKAFQATYKRRNELHSLPRAANYFLDRVSF